SSVSTGQQVMVRMAVSSRRSLLILEVATAADQALTLPSMAQLDWSPVRAKQAVLRLGSHLPFFMRRVQEPFGLKEQKKSPARSSATGLNEARLSGSITSRHHCHNTW